jgi:phosphoserine phosphatase
MTAAVTSDQLRQLLELSRKLAVTIDIEHILPEAARIACAMLDCDRASVFFFDEAADALCTHVAIGAAPICVPRGRGFVGHVFETGQPLLVPDAYADPRFSADNDRRTGFRTRDILTVPMVDLDNTPVGVLQALNSRQGGDAGGFSQTHLELLQLVADQTGVAVQRHKLSLQVVASAEMRREMDLAARVQTELLPKEIPQLQSLDVAGWSVPASVTGGDCYDLWTLGDGRLAMLVADAAGHGMAPAMVVAQVRTLVRALADVHLSPAEVLNRVNARLADDLSPQRFVTAVLAYLASDGTIDMASAGHGPILCSPAAGEPLQELPSSGLPLVIDPGPSVEAMPPLHLGPGGQLVLLSDGIFEAMDSAGELLGIERVRSLLVGACDGTADAQLGHVQRLVKEWSGDGELRDDQTIVIARRVC